MTLITEAFGKKFKKSIASGKNHSCVGVCIEDDAIFTINTNDLSQGIIEYSHKEWAAFINGAKNGEFDL